MDNVADYKKEITNSEKLKGFSESFLKVRNILLLTHTN